jgi:hypothetical protein
MRHGQDCALETTGSTGHGARRRLLRSMLLGLCLAVAGLALTREAHPQIQEGASARQPPFVLTIQGELISLRAEDASIKAMIEEIGRRLNIRVKADIPTTAKLTLAFDQLPLHEALKRFGKYVNYGYVEQWEQGELRVSTITVPSLKVTTSPTGPRADGSEGLQDNRPRARLEMNIDPSLYLREQRRPQDEH